MSTVVRAFDFPPELALSLAEAWVMDGGLVVEAGPTKSVKASFTDEGRIRLELTCETPD